MEVITRFNIGDVIRPVGYNEEHTIVDISNGKYILDIGLRIPTTPYFEKMWEKVKTIDSMQCLPNDWVVAKEIIWQLKRVESDYGIDLTTEISWLNDKVKLDK